MLSYNGNSQYDPQKSNFTVEYRGTHFGFDVGSAQSVPVMNLSTAVRLATASPDVGSSNYTLVTAEFDPGVLINGTVWVSATWSLWFAQTYDGFWLYGEGGNEATSAYVDIDAVSGAILKSFDFPTWEPLLSGNYTLNVTAADAIQTVRGMGDFHNPSPNQTFSAALTQDGNITSISPRIIKFASGADLPLQNPINSSLDGQSSLCWVISLTNSYKNGGGGQQGSFAVDAETGKVVSGWEQGLVPSGPSIFGVGSSLVIPSAKNITISQETFQMNVSAVGLPSSVPVAVPGVLVLKPGSTASIDVNFTSGIGNYVNASLQFSNPLPGLQALSSDGLPPGVSATFSNSTLALPGYTNATRAISFTLGPSAPSGTYLVSISPVSPEFPGIVGSVTFFLTVWDGAGQWPAPPSSVGAQPQASTSQTSFTTVSVKQTSTVTITVSRSSP